MTELAEAKEQLTSASQQHDEPRFLLNQRLFARDLMEKLRLPRMQRFKFHDWPLIADQPLTWVSSNTDLEELAPDDEVIRVTQVGQTTVKIHIPEKLQDEGVVLTDIFTAAKNYPEIFKKNFMTAIKADENLLTAYHMAYLNAGLFLYVPKNVEIKKPIEAEIVQDNTQDQPLISHILVVADQGTPDDRWEK